MNLIRLEQLKDVFSKNWMSEWTRETPSMALPGPGEQDILSKIQARANQPLVNPTEMIAMNEMDKALRNARGYQDAVSRQVYDDQAAVRAKMGAEWDYGKAGLENASNRASSIFQKGQDQGVDLAQLGVNLLGNAQTSNAAAAGVGNAGLARAQQRENEIGQSLDSYMGQAAQAAGGIGQRLTGLQDYGRTKADEMSAALEANMGRNDFETWGKGYLDEATDPTGQINAAKARLEDVVSGELANRLQQGGFGGVRSGAYGEDLARAGSDLILPILANTQEAQVAAGQAGLSAGDALRRAGISSQGLNQDALEALLQTGLGAEQINAGNLRDILGQGVAGQGIRAGMEGDILDAAMQAEATRTGASIAALNAGASMYGSTANMITGLTGQGIEGALGFGKLAGDQQGRALSAGLGLMDFDKDMGLGLINAENARYGPTLQAAGMVLGHGALQDDRERQRLNSALEAAGAMRQAEFQDWLRRGNNALSIYTGIPFTPGGTQKVKTEEHAGGIDYLNAILGLVGGVAGAAAA